MMDDDIVKRGYLYQQSESHCDAQRRRYRLSAALRCAVRPRLARMHAAQ